jgi:NADH:ubiquinone oxidoreductase subunit 5 (subunit L)/multisubunit Na+/H+ antiporter MnhA subunit
MESWILRILAVIGKSALWIIRYWLPMAMEGPTPVSSLLHSSTIVVAGVMLSMILGGSLVLRVSAVIMISLFLPAWFDGKKIIALSTSVHLVIIFLAVSCGLYGVCLMHILTHAFVKASCFIASRVKIRITGTQELRSWSNDNQVIVMIMSFLLLCGIGGSMIYNSKEIIVLQTVLLLIVLIGWKYTKTFFHGISGMSNSLIKINYSIIIIRVLGRTGFGGVELMLVLVILGRLIPIFNSWSGYVVNK